MQEPSTKKRSFMPSVRFACWRNTLYWQGLAAVFLLLFNFLPNSNSTAQCITSAPPVVNPNLIRCGMGTGTYVVTGAGVISGNDVYLLSIPPPSPGTNHVYNFDVTGTPNYDFLISNSPSVSQYQNSGGAITIANYNYGGPPDLPNVPANGKILLLSNNNTGSFSQPAFKFGPSSLAGGESIRGYGYPGNTVNKMSIFDFNGAPTIAVKFRVKLRNTSNFAGVWAFALGNGGAFSSSAPAANSPNYFTRIRWGLAPNLGGVTSTFTSGAVTNLAPLVQPFTQNSNTFVELYCNNKAEPIIFTRLGVQYVVPAGAMRMWVNSVPVVFVIAGNTTYVMPKNNSFTPAGNIINSLMFFTNGTNNEEIEVDDIQFQPNIETETIVSSAQVNSSGTANLNTPVLAPVSTTLYNIAQFSTGAAAPAPGCSKATAQTTVSIKVNDVPSAPINTPAALNVCGATLPANFNFSLDFGATSGTAFAIYSDATLTNITNDNITYASGTATTTIATAPQTYYITAVSAPASVGNIIDNTAEKALIYPGCSSATVLLPIQNTAVVSPVIAPSAFFVCGLTPTNLISFSTATTAASYNWNFDLLGNSSALNPGAPLTTAGPFNVYWTSAGPKTVKLTITDLNGCTSSATQVVTVYNAATPPTIQITPGGGPYCTGVPIQVTHNAGTGTQTWTFGVSGDAWPNTSTNLTANVFWNFPGGKVITLNYTDPNGCAVTTTQSITIAQQPTLTSITPSGLQVCAGASATMNITGANILLGATYTWTCDGCNEAPIPLTAAPPINLSWNSALPNANKTITLQVANPGGCVSAIANQTVGVVSLPNAAFTVTPSAPPALCTEKNFTLSMVNATGIATYTWNCGGCYQGLTNQAPPQTISWPSTVPNPTTISVTVTGAAPTNCVATSAQVLALNTIAVPVITGVLSSCVGNTETYSVPNTYASYNWVISGTNGTDYTVAPGANVNSVNITWLSAGVKAVSVTVTDANNCTATANITPNVASRPAIPTFTPAPLYCTGQNYTLNVNTPNPSLTYTWNITGNPPTPATGSGVSLPVSWAGAGTAVVTLTATNAAGCSRNSVTNLVINASPAAPVISAPSVVCGTNNNINASAPPGYATYAWTSDVNANFTGANTANPTVNWTTLGARNLTLTVGNGSGCFTSVTQAVNVNAIPQVATFIGASTVCVGNNLNITPTYNNLSAPVTYNWGCVSCASLPPVNSAGPAQISWTSAGTDIVTLSVTNADGCISPTVSATVTINPAPNSAFSASSNAVCVNGTTTVTPANLAAGNTFAWTCSGCAQAAGIANTTVGPQTISWAAATPSAKTVQLVVTSALGCVSAPTTQVITVNPLPTPGINASALSACIGSALQFTATPGGSPASNYTWSLTGSGGNITSGSGAGPITVTWTAAGNKTINLIYTDANGCTNVTPASQVITITNIPPPATITPSVNIVCGINESITVSTNAIGVSYMWNFGPGAASNGNNLAAHTVSWSSTGPKVISLTTTNALGCSRTQNITVTVYEKPLAPVITSNSPICIASDLILTGPAAKTTYLWTGPNSWALTGTSATLTRTNANNTFAGVYALQYVEPISGCTSLVGQTTVIVNPLPTIPLALTTNAPVCAGGTLLITAATIPFANYSWSGPAGYSSSSQNLTIANASVALHSGTYVLTATVPGCTTLTASMNAEVNNPPFPPAPTNNGPVCLNGVLNLSVTPSVNGIYTWSGPGSFNSTFPNPSRTNMTSVFAGNYSVTVSTPGCAPVSGQTAVTVYDPVIASNSPVCAGGLLKFTATNYSAATYSWQGPNGQTLVGSNPIVNPVGLDAAGPWVLTVTIPGCTPLVLASSPVVVNAPPAAPTPGVNANPVCAGGSLVLTTNTVTGASYAWSGPAGFTNTAQNPPPITNLTTSNAGSYNVTVTVPGCAPATGSVNVAVNDLPQPVIQTSTTTVCEGASFSLAVLNAVPAANYIWQGPDGFAAAGANATVNNATTLKSGVYSVTASLPGCSNKVSTVTITVNKPPLAPNPTNNGPLCSGQQLQLNATASPGASYSWVGPGSPNFTNGGAIINPTVANISTSNAGVYSITVTVPGCPPVTGTTALVVNTPPAAPNLISNSPACVGQNLSLAITNPSANATYSWNGPNGFSNTLQNPNIANVTTAAAGVYSVTVSVPACSSVTGVIGPIVVNTPPAAPVVSSNSPVCANAVISLTVSNIVAGATYNWSGPGFSQNAPVAVAAAPSSAGVYTYSATATVAGCAPVVSTANVTVNAPVTGIAVAPAQTLCVGDNLNLTASAIPTLSNVSYQWNGPAAYSSTQQNPTFANVATAQAGVYTVVANTPGCASVNATVSVAVNAAPGAITLTSNSPVCLGQNLQLTATNVSGAQSYQWSGPGGFSANTATPTLTLNNVSSFNAGAYSVTVTVSGCSATSSATSSIVVQDPNAVSIVSNAPVCAGSTLDLQAVGNEGTANATYQWLAPNGFIFSGKKVSIPNIAPFFAGTFTLTTTIPNCTSAQKTTNVIVNNAPASPSPSSNSPVCAGNDLSLSANATSGAIYQWNGPNGFVDFGQNLNISGANVTTANSGEYTVTVTLGSCSRTGTVKVTVGQPLPSDYKINSNSPICTGETLNLSVANASGASFVWGGPNGFSATTQNPSLSNVTTAAIGAYSLTVNVPGCPSSFFTHTPVIRLTPANPNPQSNAPICEGSTLRLTAAGTAGASYVWTGPNSFTSTLQNPTINSVTTARSGSYNVTVVTEGCAPKTGSVSVNINAIPSVEATSNAPVCQGGALNLLATSVPEATYQWFGPGGITFTQQNPTRTNIQVTDAGVYTLIVTVPGCDPVARTTSVVVNSPIAAPVLNSNGPVCTGATLRLSASSIAGATYSWTGPNGFVSSERNPVINNVTLDAEGDYSLIATRLGCPSTSANISVRVIPAPTNAAASSNSPVCAGTIATLTAAAVANATYSWSGPGGFSSTEQNPNIANVRANQAGVYTLTVTVAGCPAVTRTTALTVNALPTSVTPQSNSPLCEGGLLILTAPGITGAGYTWSGPDGFFASQATATQSNVTAANSGSYSVTVSVPGCGSVTGAVAVEVNANPEGATVANNGPVCEGGAISFTISGASPKTRYSWSGPSGFASTESGPSLFNVTPANSGLYQVVLQTPGCGSLTRNSVVTVNPGAASLAIIANTPVCQGGTLRLSTTVVSGASYTWSGPGGFTASGPIATVNNVTTANAGVYELAANIPGCGAVRASLNVAINPSLAQVTINNNGPVCEGATIQFSATAIEGASYNWSGPSGFSSTETNPLIPSASLLNSGVYTLAVSSAGCGARSLTTTLSVAPGARNFNITSNAPICAGQSLIMSVPQTQGATYAWAGPSGFSATGAGINIPQASTANGGVYTVVANVPGCGTLSATTQAIVNASVASITAGNNGPICTGSGLSLTVTASPEATYSWRGPNGYSSTQQAPTISNANTANSGIYTVTVSTPQCGSRTATTLAVVNPSPAEIIAINNGPLCTNGVLVLNATFVAGASYFWSGPAGFSSTEANPVISGVTPLNSGVYNVSVLLPGCGLVTRTTSVTVNSSLLSVVAGNNGPVCTGTALQLTATTVAGGTYSWRGPNGFTSTMQNPVIENISPAAAGNYQVEINSPACGNITITTFVVIRDGFGEVALSNNGPLCEGQTLALTATSVAGASYAWSGPRGFSASGASVSRANVVLADSGVYSVTVTIPGCSSANYTTKVAIRGGSNIQSVSQPQNQTLCRGEETSFDIFFTGTGPWLLTYTENGVAQVSQEATVSPYRLTVRPNGVGERTYVFGCNNITRNITVRPAVALALVENAAAGCGSTGSLRVAASGGTGDYTYTLTPGNVVNTTGSFTSLAAGVYTVTARDEAGCSSSQTYTVVGQVAAPAPIVSNVTTSSVSVSWSLVSGAVSYTLQYRAAGSGANFNALTGVTGNTATVTGLSGNTSYELRVIALCQSGVNSEPSESVIATTLRPQAPEGCVTPGLLPVNVESNTSARIRWLPNQSGATCYVIAYGPASQDPATWQQFLVTHPFSEVLLTGLTPGVRYGIRIRTNCTLCSIRSGEFTPFSSISEFTMPGAKAGSINAREELALEIYPNPTQGAFAIRYETESLLPARVSIRNLAGQVIYETTLTPSGQGSGLETIDLQGTPAGVYLVEFTQGQERIQTKLMLQP